MRRLSGIRPSAFTADDVRAAYETIFVFGLGNPLPPEEFFTALDPDEAVRRLALIGRLEDQKGFPNLEDGTWEKAIYADISKARKK